MISLAKILFTLAAVIGVWTVFRLVRRWASGQPRVTPAERGAQAARDSVEGRWTDPARTPELDLVRCPACGSYGPRGQACPCGRDHP
ncbi:hypothetical protein [Pararhodospirillum photometricum]|nr:hypothetical protein [Pararhodospirillum photometricum]